MKNILSYSKRVFSVVAILVIASNIFVSVAQAISTVQLSVDNVRAVANQSGSLGYATADDNYDHGWRWIFDVTVPQGETVLNMKFDDWTNGSSVIPAAGNIRFYSAQSTNASASTSAITISTKNVYSGDLYISPNQDLKSYRAGRQIQIVVETKVPVGTLGGSFSTSYGIQSNLDTIAPVITLVGANPQTVERTTTPYPELGATAVDDVDGVVVVTSNASATVNTNIVGTYTVTYSATDSAFNTATLDRTVNVIDTTAPTATVSYSTTALTNQNVVATITPSETVIGDLTHNFTENGSFTFNFTDLAGNPGSVIAEVNNIDKIAPTATVSYSTTVLTNQNVVATITPSETITVTNNGGSTSYPFTENGSFTFNFTDLAGNAGSVTATVNNIDKVAPVITAPADVSAEATGLKTIVNLGIPTVSDNSDVAPTVTNGSPEDGFVVGTHTVTWTATDGSGNSATATQTVIITDVTAPVIIGTPSDIAVESALGLSMVVTYTNPTATDLADGALAVSCVPASGSVFALGTTLVTCSATDVTGNPAIPTTFNVTVRDTTAPTATVAHDETAKTITYTFSEAVKLTTNDGTLVPTSEIASKLAVYQVTGLDYTTVSMVTGVTIDSADLVGDVLTIHYTGTLVDQTNTKYVVDAWGYKITDLAGNKLVSDASQMFTVTGVDTIAPTATVAHDESSKTITYTFSEPVQLVNQSGGAVTSLAKELLGIYKIVGTDYGPDKVAGVNIDSANLVGNVLTIHYTGSLVRQTDTNYLVDAWGYSITDLVGNRIVQNPSQVFTVTGDTTAPTATVAHNEVLNTITYIFSEEVKLTTNDGTLVPTSEIASKLAVYQVTGSDYTTASKVDGITIDSANLVGNVLTITYTGTLVAQTNTKYVVDAWGYKITDLAGNQMVSDPSQMFEVISENQLITISFGDGGSISAVVPSGSNPKYDIKAEAGYYISDVKVDDESVVEQTGFAWITENTDAGYTFANVTAPHTLSAVFELIPPPAPNPTTVNASGVISTGATLNGTVGISNADNTSFWYGTSSAGPFTAATDPTVPSGWITPSVTGAHFSGSAFSQDITGLTPGTYYFVAWNLVGGIWYPGTVQTFITATPATAVGLGTAADFAILANTGISSTGVTSIVGDIGTGPAVTSAAISGNFALALDSSGQFSKSTLVNGKVYAYDYAVSTPAKMNTAANDMGLAYTAAAGRPHGVGPNLGIGGGTVTTQTLAPGVYTWGSNVTITGDITLAGTATDVWIFQISGTLDIADGKKIILAGALPQNIFWQVADAVTLKPGSHFEGNILAQTNIAMQTGATLNGRALAQTAVTLDANTVANPSVTVTPPAPAANLVLTAPATATITRSDLLAETSGVANNNDAVATAVAGLTPIAVRLQNTGNAASVNALITPINAGSHIQLWAKDTSNNWYDINVTGWVAVPGVAFPANYDETTNVYAISDLAGGYPLIVNLVNASAPSTVLATASGTVTVNARVPMTINSSLPTFTAGVEAPFTVGTVANGDVGKMVLAHFTIPTGASVTYQAPDGSYLPLTDVYGPATGFPVGDVTSNFKANFASAGTYTVTVDFKLLNGTLVATKDITTTVDAIPNQ